MSRFYLAATLGAVSLGLVSCGEYKAEYKADTGEGTEAVGGNADQAQTGDEEGTRIVVNSDGTRVRIDPDGTRVRIGPDGARIDLPDVDVDVDARVRSGEDPQIEINTNRR